MAKMTMVEKCTVDQVQSLKVLIDMPKTDVGMFFEHQHMFGQAWLQYASSYDSYINIKRLLIDVENVNRTYKSSIKKYRQELKKAVKQAEKFIEKGKEKNTIEFEYPQEIKADILMVMRTYGVFVEAFLYTFMDKIKDIQASQKKRIDDCMAIFDMMQKEEFDLSLVKFYPAPDRDKGVTANNPDLLLKLLEKDLSKSNSTEAYLLTMFEYFWISIEHFRNAKIVDINVPEEKYTPFKK